MFPKIVRYPPKWSIFFKFGVPLFSPSIFGGFTPIFGNTHIDAASHHTSHFPASVNTDQGVESVTAAQLGTIQVPEALNAFGGITNME